MDTRNPIATNHHAVEITISQRTAPVLEIPHLNVHSAKVITQPAIRAALYIKKSNVAISLLQIMLSFQTVLDLRHTMYKIATQEMMPLQILLVPMLRLPLANAQSILLPPPNLTLI